MINDRKTEQLLLTGCCLADKAYAHVQASRLGLYACKDKDCYLAETRVLLSLRSTLSCWYDEDTDWQNFPATFIITINTTTIGGTLLVQRTSDSLTIANATSTSTNTTTFATEIVTNINSLAQTTLYTAYSVRNNVIIMAPLGTGSAHNATAITVTPAGATITVPNPSEFSGGLTYLRDEDDDNCITDAEADDTMEQMGEICCECCEDDIFKDV